MRWNLAKTGFARPAVFFAAVAGAAIFAQTVSAAATQTLMVRAAGFTLGEEKSVSAGTNRLELALDPQSPATPPFVQSAVKQSVEPALLGPDPKIPYFTVRFALPIPPENAASNVAALVGIDPEVFTHNHSPGFEILPNGDCLAIWFSTPPGESESAKTTSFIQARLRYGSEEWDMPELFYKTEGFNDQSGLLWKDGKKIWFFGGGRGLSDWVPFKIATSTDNGVTWTLSLPQLDQPAVHFTAQPITSAFRSGAGFQPAQAGKMPAPLPIYFAMDGDKAQSFLWRSADDGIHWTQMPGRTGGRHSQIVPLDDHGDLLSIGGKNANVDGWSPENFSTNWGATWSKSQPSPFPPLGSGQRPCLIRLADGNLFFTSDAYLNKYHRPPPPGWKYGNGCFVALSTNNGASWRVKPLPVQLPNHMRGTNGTLGYVTARQAPNGVIHILTTETQPCLDYELNEAWILSDAGDIAPETSGGTIRKFSEKYPNGQLRSTWSARICPHGRYLLDGTETDFYASGAKQHEVICADGRKTGLESFWSPEGKLLWTWAHDLKDNRATWTQFWPNGQRKLQSTWNTKPEARDLKRSFFGLVADGPVFHWDENGKLTAEYRFTNGIFVGAVTIQYAPSK
jgi:BNR repeat-like domain/MORN repeat variant